MSRKAGLVFPRRLPGPPCFGYELGMKKTVVALSAFSFASVLAACSPGAPSVTQPSEPGSASSVPLPSQRELAAVAHAPEKATVSAARGKPDCDSMETCFQAARDAQGETEAKEREARMTPEMRAEQQEAASIQLEATVNATLDKYNEIKTGMTYVHVVKIMRNAGQEMSSSDAMGHHTAVFAWQNADGSAMSIVFEDYRVMTKSQFGLR